MDGVKWWRVGVALVTLLLAVGVHGQSLISLVKFMRDGLRHSSSEPKDQNTFLKEYDFIVVGAGSAGCVVANRLTEVTQR